MSKHLKKYNSDFKLKVVLKYFSNELTMSQLCQNFNVSKSAIHKWVKQFKSNSSLIFNESNLSKNSKRNDIAKEKEVSNLYSKIGQLTVERDYLKKVLGS